MARRRGNNGVKLLLYSEQNRIHQITKMLICCASSSANAAKFYPSCNGNQFSKYQRQLTRAIKRARQMALLPYTND